MTRKLLSALSYILLLSSTSALKSDTYAILSDESLKNIASPGDSLDHQKGDLLSPLMITRVPGTEGSKKSLQHFHDFFAKLNWNVSYDNFTDHTPIKTEAVPFVNLWATLDPPWIKNERHMGDLGRLVLVAHYDSKIEPAGFIGATDSAAPCAMLMHIARSIDQPLRRRWKKLEEENNDIEQDQEMGIMILLLDGEEAFQSWTHTDSLYGARHLAEHWESMAHPAMSTYKTQISSISLFVLLDLLGGPFPNVISYYETSHWAYQAISNLEVKLRKANMLQTSPSYKAFLSDSTRNHFTAGFGIEDDHLPFLHRGVEILHMIPTPFPTVWHTMNDDGAHLDKKVCDDWAVLFLAFTCEYLGLDGYMNKSDAVNGVIGDLKQSDAPPSVEKVKEL